MNYYDDMIIIFLDILGTKDTQEFKTMFNIHSTFHTEMLNHQERQNNLPHVKYLRESRSFSDCAYLIYKLKEGTERSEENLLNLFYTALYNSTISILQFYSRGFLVRGGATIGKAYTDELGFFGPGINQAYTLEDKIARVPRVVLNKELGEKLSLIEEMRIQNANPLILDLMNPKRVLLIQKDEDGEYFLNIFYQLQISGAIYDPQGFQLEFSKILDTLETKIENELIVNEANEKIVEKLTWMQKYLRSLEANDNNDNSWITTIIT